MTWQALKCDRGILAPSTQFFYKKGIMNERQLDTQRNKFVAKVLGLMLSLTGGMIILAMLIASIFV